MVTIEDAFIDAWRSYRIRQGDRPDSLPDPIGRRAKKPPSKNRRIAEIEKDKLPEEAIETSGGFFVDEDNAGGFIADDDDGVDNDAASDELETDNTDTMPMKPQHLPLSSIPDALASLSLPTNDNFVLDLFAQTAILLNDDARRRRRPGTGLEGSTVNAKVVSLGDFERVANVLLDGNEASLSSDEEAQVSAIENDEGQESTRRSSRRPVCAAASFANKRRRKQIRGEQQEDVEIASDDEDVYSEACADSEEEQVEESNKLSRKTSLGTGKKRRDGSSTKTSASGGVRRKRKSNTHKADTTATDENDEEEEGHLNATQRRTVHAAFRLFTDKLKDIRNTSLDEYPRLGKDDLKLLVKSVGEKISEKEIDEMIDEGVRFFAKASSKDVTRQTAKLRREAASGRASARGESNRAVTIGIDEFGGILLQGRMI